MDILTSYNNPFIVPKDRLATGLPANFKFMSHKDSVDYSFLRELCVKELINSEVLDDYSSSNIRKETDLTPGCYKKAPAVQPLSRHTISLPAMALPTERNTQQLGRLRTQRAPGHDFVSNDLNQGFVKGVELRSSNLRQKDHMVLD